MISLKNLNVTLGDKKIIKDLSLDFKQGKFNAIVGPNGCGKSTIIKTIARLHKNNTGNIIVDGKEITNYKRKELAQKISYLMQTKEANNDFTVEEYVTYGRQPYAKKFKKNYEEDRIAIENAIKVTGISDLRDQIICNLSGGERQRVYLALAIAQEPDILILDEPTNHLDLKYQYGILNLIKKLNLENKITIICVLHDLNHAMRFADHVFVIKDGQLDREGLVDDVISVDMIRKTYGIECRLCTNNKYNYIEVI